MVAFFCSIGEAAGFAGSEVLIVAAGDPPKKLFPDPGADGASLKTGVLLSLATGGGAALSLATGGGAAALSLATGGGAALSRATGGGAALSRATGGGAALSRATGGGGPPACNSEP